MDLTITVQPGSSVELDAINPEETFGLAKEQTKERLDELTDELADLQELLYAARQHSVLIILQGMDTSGKDGTVKKVMEDVNPLGCRVESFKVPTEEELAHDFLWRIHRVTPPKGILTIFNRSQYEDVLVVRVHKLVDDAVWKRRYQQINDFEKLLSDSGTIILKFFLYISKEEQKKRLLEREEDPSKAWKLSAGDWRERTHWDEYRHAYEEALTKCSTDWANWHVVPANNKWFRNLAVADRIAHALRPYRKEWEKSLDKLAAEKIAELAAFRESKREGEKGR